MQSLNITDKGVLYEYAEIAGFSEIIKFHEICNGYFNYTTKRDNDKKKKDDIRLNALKTCRDWTNTDCKNAMQIIPMLEKYKKLQKRLDNRKKIPQIDKEGCNNITNYMRQNLYYQHEIDNGKFIHKLSGNPSLEEMHDYSTFHWALDLEEKKRNPGHYISNEIYDIVLGELDTTTDDDDDNEYINSIHNYRDIIQKYLIK